MQDSKQRHGCLTALLIVMIVLNAATALFYLVGSAVLRDMLPNAPGWLFPVLVVFSLFNLVCAIALLQWKKWAFWGFAATSIVGLVINLSIGLGIGKSLAGLVGLAVLYGTLQIGNENKGWPQLE